MDQPPFDRSPLDGYALHSADTAGASRETPVTLPVTMKLYAGDAVGRADCKLPLAGMCGYSAEAF